MFLIRQPLSCTAVLAATEYSERVSLNIKICLVTNSGERIDRNTDINLYDTMASRAGQVVVMTVTADAVMVRAIRELDTIQQADINQQLYRAIDGCPAQTWLYLA